MKSITTFFLAKYNFSSSIEKLKAQALVLFIITSIILLFFFMLHTVAIERYNTLYTQFIYLLLGFSSLWLIKIWNYIYIGNFLSFSLVLTEVFSMIFNFSNGVSFNFFFDEFYILIIYIFFSSLFSSRILLVVNTLIILIASEYSFNLHYSLFPSDYVSEFEYGMGIYVIVVVLIFSFSYLSRYLIIKAIKEISDKVNIAEQKSSELIVKQRKLKVQQEELKFAKEKAEESDKLKSVFLANVSHEIRTPMNAILGLAGLLKVSELNDKQKKYVDVILDSGNSLVSLIDDILDYAKHESKQVVEEAKCNINEIIESIVLSLNLQIKKEKEFEIKVSLGLGNNDAIIYTDEKRLRQIILNLLNNSIKFTEKGSVIISYIKQDDSTLLFSVIDNGIGIKKEMIPLIFNPFRQIDESNTRKYGGAGLGLSIAKSFVELLGGKIWVNSVFGQGSTFNFTIPYKRYNK